MRCSKRLMTGLAMLCTLVSVPALAGVKVLGKTSGTGGALPTFTSARKQFIINSAFPSPDSAASRWNLAATMSSGVLHMGEMLTAGKPGHGDQFVADSSGSSSMGAMADSTLESQQSSVSCNADMGNVEIAASFTESDPNGACSSAEMTVYNWSITTNASGTPTGGDGTTAMDDVSTVSSDGTWYLISGINCSRDAGSTEVAISAPKYRKSKFTVSGGLSSCTINYTNQL